MTLAFGEDTAGLMAGLGINTFFTGSDARTMALDTAIAADPGRIAAALVGADGLVHPGDGAGALALARLRTALVMNGGTETLTGAYAQIVAQVGGATRDAGAGSERAQTSLLLAESLHAQTSGVSTDEELVNLTQSQHAYAAAARFVTTLDEVTRTLLGMAG
jgi:flagellar hook-associated protein 1 FlgK